MEFKIMPDSLRNTDKNLSTLLRRIQDLIDLEQDHKTRIVLTNMQLIIEELDDTNKIVDSQTVIIKRHNDIIQSFQRTADKLQGMLVVMVWVLGIAQILVFSAGSYIFTNTTDLLSGNAVILEKLDNVDKFFNIHQQATDNIKRETLP